MRKACRAHCTIIIVKQKGRLGWPVGPCRRGFDGCVAHGSTSPIGLASGLNLFAGRETVRAILLTRDNPADTLTSLVAHPVVPAACAECHRRPPSSARYSPPPRVPGRSIRGPSISLRRGTWPRFQLGIAPKNRSIGCPSRIPPASLCGRRAYGSTATTTTGEGCEPGPRLMGNYDSFFRECQKNRMTECLMLSTSHSKPQHTQH